MHKIRLAISFLFLLILLLVLVGRLWYIQLFKSSFFQNKAVRQHAKTIKLDPKRGTIYDRKGIKLAISMEVNSVFADPNQIKEKCAIARKLSYVLGLRYKEVYNRIRKKGTSFVWVKRKISAEETNALKKLELEGIYFLKENKRFYSHKEIASHLLGFVGIDNQGLEGIEKFYDEYIRGKPGFAIIEKDGRGRKILGGKHRIIPSSDGYNLVLTIDEVIQYIAERELARAFHYHNAKSGCVVIMIPQTGEILAMATRPTYNPNNFRKSHPDFWRNRVITDVFEPGSIFKIITAAAALDKKAVEEKDIFYCEQGAWKTNKHIIHDVHKHSWLSFSRVIEESSNIGIVKVARELGEKNLYKYIRNFGFGEKTGIDLPGEVRGLLRPLEKWTRTSLDAIPYGQEISVTSLQMISAVSAVANEGVLMKPHLVKYIKDSEGRIIKTFKPTRVRRVIAESIAQSLSLILEKTVERGTGISAQIPGYAVAGKTGTAQKIDFQRGGYSNDKFVSSFVGYIPADNPQIVMLVVLDEPQKDYYGSLVAAPLFKQIGAAVLKYLNKDEKGLKDLKTNEQKGFPLSTKMPSLKGKTMRQTLKMLAPYNLKVKLEGSGWVTVQHPLPGTEIKEGESVWVRFERHPIKIKISDN